MNYDDFFDFLGVCCYDSMFLSDDFNWEFSQCLLVSLYRGLSILLIFLKNQLFALLLLCIVLLVSVLLISALSLIVSHQVFLLGLMSSFCLGICI